MPVWYKREGKLWAERNPHSYQLRVISTLLNTPALAVWADMGMGKCVMTLTAFDQLKYNYFLANKCLVVAPAKVAEATWQREGQEWWHLRRLKFSTVIGSPTKRVQALYTPADIYVISRDNLPWLVEYYGNDWPFDFVVLDEASGFKDSKTKRFKKMKAIRPRVKRIVELTGTPTPKSYEDLWSQIFLLDFGDRLGQSLAHFRSQFFLPDKRNRQRVYSWKEQEGAREAIDRKIQDLCVCVRACDYLDMPPLLEEYVPVVLDERARKLYNKLERDLLLEVDGETITADTAAVLSSKLLQAASGFGYLPDSSVLALHSAKADILAEIVSSLDGSPTLIAYSFRAEIDAILGALPKNLRAKKYEGAADEEAWNNGGLDVMLVHPRSAGYGLNLQRGGRHIIWYGNTWSAEEDAQLIARLYRQGQTQPVVVIRLVVEGTREDDVREVVRGRIDAQDGLKRSLSRRIEAVKEGRQYA